MKKLAILFSLLISACASSGGHDQVSSGMGKLPLDYSEATTVEEIRQLKPQSKLPLNIAVMPPKGWRSELTFEERKVIKGWEEELKEIGFVNWLQIVPKSLIPECHYRRSDRECFFNDSRVAGARMKADAILFLNASSVTEEYVNPLSILNLSVVGMWFAPAHHRDTNSIYEAALFDVNNGYLYAVSEGQGEYKSLRPYMYADSDTGEAEAKKMALDDLGKQLIALAKDHVSKNIALGK
ncbi:hypothetical protein PVT68_08545 [Microbulbifer bruguierae]|uniref:Lipoprotein n=1 Tax=Microbulbifer bruguierae TaxID=3029061 RepID=A0ABY8NHB9_9GAMM|nr:hypothetical protein [Microbulbifer bruguierae]WGL18329.1 hypothetical protein PVT68_08545 [Microbulbifer bruguierae]